MIDHIANYASTVIECSPPPPSHDSYRLPSPPNTPANRSRMHNNSQEPSAVAVPPLNDFIRLLVLNSNVQSSTLLPTLVYLERLKYKLPVAAKGKFLFFFIKKFKGGYKRGMKYISHFHFSWLVNVVCVVNRPGG
jgi:hypothetical protein